ALAVPGACLVRRTRTCLDDAATLRRLQQGALDVKQEVVIAGCDGVPPAGGPAEAGSVEIRRYAPDHVVLDATTAVAAYLVLADAWFPGWQVRVDGAEQTLWRADHALRAVWLPPGRRGGGARRAGRCRRVRLGRPRRRAILGVRLCHGGPPGNADRVRPRRARPAPRRPARHPAGCGTRRLVPLSRAVHPRLGRAA